MTDKAEPNQGTVYWAWVSRYPDGSVGNIGISVAGFEGLLVTRSEDVARVVMRSMAEIHAKNSGQRCWLRRYEMTEDELDVIEVEVDE